MRTLLVLFTVAAAAWAQDREITDCEICGGAVYQTPKTYITGRTKNIWIGDPPHKPYCTRCQRDVNNGKIDPNDPPVLAPRDDEEQPDGGNPYAVDKFDWEKKGKNERKLDKDAESGFGALPWVAGVVIGVGLLIRFFLK